MILTELKIFSASQPMVAVVRGQDILPVNFIIRRIPAGRFTQANGHGQNIGQQGQHEHLL